MQAGSRVAPTELVSAAKQGLSAALLGAPVLVTHPSKACRVTQAMTFMS